MSWQKQIKKNKKNRQTTIFKAQQRKLKYEQHAFNHN